MVGGRRILLTERKRVANPHCREGRRPSTSLIAGQVAPEPALEGKVTVRRERDSAHTAYESYKECGIDL